MEKLKWYGITGKTFYLWLEYFEVLSGDSDLVMHFEGAFKVIHFFKNFTPFKSNAVFLGRRNKDR